MTWVLASLAAFLVGSLPWGLWIGKLVRGVDVRRFGSGNLGATNVYRVLGPAWGITVLLLDAAKGTAAVFAARAVVGGGGDAMVWAGFLGLVASVLGHTFSPFARFHGGKGVATAAGAWGVLGPAPLVFALLVWSVVFALTRIVSVSSVSASIALIPGVLLAPRLGLAPPAAGESAGGLADPLLWVSVLTAVLLTVRHRGNFRRLRRGEEKPLDLRGSAQTARRNSS